MFTGIIEALGRIEERSGARLTLECDLGELDLGESVSVNGVCLTVVEATAGGFCADVSEETFRRTALQQLRTGDPVNLERAMQVGERFGGHMVQGHVDGIGRVVARDPLDGSVEITFEAPEGLARYLVHKGSVAVDGISLTLATLEGNRFGVSVIPHTLEHTNLGARRPGDAVNLEVDILAKYVERLLENVPTDHLRR